jgi:L-fuconolactonase
LASTRKLLNIDDKSVSSSKEDRIFTEREDWLRLTVEEPLEPDIPICDPHHHLWYDADENYVIEDFLKDISGGHCVVQTVFVESRQMLAKGGPEAMQPVGETEYVVDIATSNSTGQQSKTKVAAGIVGFADLMLGTAVAPVLEAHIAAGKGRFRGVRYATAWDASPEIRTRRKMQPGILLDTKFREGFSYLKKYGLSFDALSFHPQLMELADLARAFPDTPIIVEHVGGPLGIGPYAPRREEAFRDWQQGMAALAGCPNVYVKLGGFGMEMFGFGWHERPRPPDSSSLAEAMAPYFSWCIERFGTGRCMFESNFPVDKRSYSYTVIWNAFKRLSKDISPGERRRLFLDNAVSAYRLSPEID